MKQNKSVKKKAVNTDVNQAGLQNQLENQLGNQLALTDDVDGGDCGDGGTFDLTPEGVKRLEGLFAVIHNKKKRQWLTAVASCGRLYESQRLTGVDRRFHYLWLKKDPDYPAAYEEAKSIACDAAEDEVWRRAFAGRDRPLSFKGKLTGDTIKEYSDLLAMFMLKGARPSKFREDSKIQINLNTPPAVNIVAPEAIDVPDADIVEDEEKEVKV
jgi:hypothetical protein